MPSVGISKRRLKQLETIQLIREERENGRQQLAYNARPFVLCGLPLRQLLKDQLYYTRRNGAFFLEITAHPRFGMPFGQDRLIPIWVATLAVQQKSREVRFSSAAQILAFFSLPKDGPHYRRMVEGFQRVFAATIFFGTRQHTNGEGYADLGRFQFFDRMQLWFNTVERPQAPNTENFDNMITLSEAFYNEINEHRIPVERNVVAALANAPGVLDFYMWLVWKTWTLKSSAVIPLVAERGLNEQLGSKEYTEPRFFRAKVKSWLRQVKALWPQCSALIVSDGLSIMVQSSRQNPAIRAVEKTVNL